MKHTETCDIPICVPVINSKEAKIMAVNEKIRFKIKGYDHATVDIAAAKIVEREAVQEFRVLSRSLPTRKLLQFSVLYTSTRTAVSSSR